MAAFNEDKVKEIIAKELQEHVKRPSRKYVLMSARREARIGIGSPHQVSIASLIHRTGSMVLIPCTPIIGRPKSRTVTVELHQEGIADPTTVCVLVPARGNA